VFRAERVNAHSSRVIDDVQGAAVWREGGCGPDDSCEGMVLEWRGSAIYFRMHHRFTGELRFSETGTPVKIRRPPTFRLQRFGLPSPRLGYDATALSTLGLKSGDVLPELEFLTVEYRDQALQLALDGYAAWRIARRSYSADPIHVLIYAETAREDPDFGSILDVEWREVRPQLAEA